MNEAQRAARITSLVEDYLQLGQAAPALDVYLSTVDAEVRDEVAARCRDAAFLDGFFAKLPPMRVLPPMPAEVGGCRLGELLGEGAMGKVFRATQVELGREVAVKLVRADVAHDERMLARLRDESRALAALDHPGIVKVLFCGEAEGWLYFVMEYVAGRSLAEQLPALLRQLGNAGPRRFDRVARIVAEVLDALAYAHGQGIVHRDLKPSNVMLDGDGRVKLVDFGLAKGAGSAQRTLPGQLVGTPAYLCPEVVAHRAHDRFAPDLWAVGVMLFQLTTGRLPYGGGDTGEVLTALLRPVAIDPQRVRPDVPKPLAAICARALAPDAAARYCSAAEFAADLRRFLAGETVRALRGNAIRTARLHLRRRAREYTAAIVAASALVTMWLVHEARASELRIEKQIAGLVPASDITASAAGEIANSAARAMELLAQSLPAHQRRVASEHMESVRREAARRHAEGVDLVRRGAGSAHGEPIDEYRAPSAPLVAAGITRIAESRLMWPDLPGPEAVVASVQPVLVVTAPAFGPQPVRVEATDPITCLPQWIAARGVTPCEISVPVGHYRIVVGSSAAFAEVTRTIVAPGRYIVDATLRATMEVQRGMAFIGAGRATVGQRDKRSPAYAERDIEHRAFFVDCTEVTCGEYHTFMLATNAPAPRNWPGPFEAAWAQLPVSGVSFIEAARYAEWVGKRLPTWSEWQIAARGRGAAKYPWGDDPARLTRLPTIGAASSTPWQIGVSAVGTTADDQSWCGAFDMLGNVPEWTESPYVASADGVPTPMFAWRVRGGNSYSTGRNSSALTLAAVGAGPPEVMDTGFRCAKSASIE